MGENFGEWLGQRLGPYRIEGRLGLRGDDLLFSVVHEAIGQRAALKVPGGASAEARCAHSARFFQEARALSSLHHPAVIKIFDFGEFPDGTPYLLTELLGGKSLRERLSGSPGKRLSARFALRIAAAVAQLLTEAHGGGLVHGGLSPERIQIVPVPDAHGSERIVLADFAGCIFTNSPGWPGAAAASAYRPPSTHGEASSGDVYSLGVVLYEMLLGGLPGAAPWELEGLLALGAGAEIVADLLRRMLAVDPGARPAMDAVAVALAPLAAPVEDPPTREAPPSPPQIEQELRFCPRCGPATLDHGRYGSPGTAECTSCGLVFSLLKLPVV